MSDQTTKLQELTASMSDAVSFRILIVCTGNICRSPAVERLLASQFANDDGVSITSAGVGAVVGAPIAPGMASLLVAEGADVSGFAARQVTEQMLRSSHLVLALTRAHRSRIVDLAPAVVRRTFTLRELARLASGVDPALLPSGTLAQRCAALLPLATSGRRGIPVAPGDDDVVDPWGGTDTLYEESFDQLASAVQSIISVVVPHH
jgi:protein-tyrosine phosphatase